MRIAKSLVLAAAVAGGMVGALGIGAAIAQTGGASSAVLVVDLDRLSSQAPAWADMQTKLNTLIQAKTTELRTQNRAAAESVETETRALQPLVEGKTDAQINADPALKARIQTLQARQQDLALKARVFEASRQGTIQRAQNELYRELDPVLDQIMTARGASVGLQGGAVVKVRPAIDITQEALTRFNAAHPTAPQPIWAQATVGADPAAASVLTVPPAGLPKGAQKK